MLRVYLDQNKWIDLARAATSHRLGESFVNTLALARIGVASRLVSFPLDLYRYWETSKRSDDQSRNDVVDVMRELSQQHTIAPSKHILYEELDIALQRRFGRPEHVRRRQVFGVGIKHITDNRIHWPKRDFGTLLDDGRSQPKGLRARLSHSHDQFIEEHLLRAGPQTINSAGVDHAASDHGQRFVDYENAIAAAVALHGLRGDAIDQAVRAADLGDIRPAVTEALGNIGLDFDEFVSSSNPIDLMNFMDDLPTRYVTNVMRSAKHRHSQQSWEPNDFIDVLALPIAAVYCDVVITEKQWVHRMRHGGVERRYNTILLTDTADLVDVLVGASVT